MPLNLYYDKNNVVRFISNDKVTSQHKHISLDVPYDDSLVGKTIKSGKSKEFRLAVICNWNDKCGISTYSKYLIDELKLRIDKVKVFSEDKERDSCVDDPKIEVEYTWKRSFNMSNTIKKVLDWNPTLVLIQHEFGIFPKASHFFTMMEMLSGIPTAITLHSVYEHRDKSICTSIIDNIIVHSDSGKKCLREILGHERQNIFVIPHGCIDLGDVKPHFNQFGVSHPIMQFGFGFNYKGVDVALEAISILKKRDDKYKDIFYCYLCSESKHAKNTHNLYYRSIKDKIEELELESNATIQRGFFTDLELQQFLRTSRLSVFPYISDPKNIVYGASGAIRVAMANGNPVIASSSHMFDDLEGVLPRPSNSKELADEISKVFNDGKYRSNLIKKQRDYIMKNSWSVTADRYIDAFRKIIDSTNKDYILI